MQTIIRNASAGDIYGLAQLWFDGWQDAHIDILPEELAKHRTVESFCERLLNELENVRAATMGPDLLGFSMIKNDELYQLYVAAEGRGSGIAARLNANALAQIKDQGFKMAWLACAIGNARAARFYEKNGWRQTGTITSELETPDGIFPLEVWRYEIDLDI